MGCSVRVKWEKKKKIEKCKTKTVGVRVVFFVCVVSVGSIGVGSM